MKRKKDIILYCCNLSIIYHPGVDKKYTIKQKISMFSPFLLYKRHYDSKLCRCILIDANYYDVTYRLLVILSVS